MQYTNLSVSSSMILAQSGACQLTGYTIYNPNTTDVWLKFYDSTDVTSAATGTTATYKVLIPAGSQVIEYVDSGNTTDPDGMWAFANGITLKCVTGYLVANGTAPTTAIEIYLQIKP